MSTFTRDVRFGSRSLRKHFGLSILAIAALWLGIGLTTAMFSIMYGALMRGLPCWVRTTRGQRTSAGARRPSR